MKAESEVGLYRLRMCWPSLKARFFLRGKFIPKIAIFGDFGGRKATFLKP